MPTAVLSIVSSSSPASIHVKQAAAVYLKNRIARTWSSSSSNETVTSPTSTASNAVSDQDKAAVKQNILRVLVENSSHKNIQVQLKTCIATITSSDFPEQWPGLLEDVVSCIQASNGGDQDKLPVVQAGLLVLIEILKVYRYRRHDREVPNQLCATAMPILVNLGQALLAQNPAPSAPEHVGTTLHLISKAYKISIVADISPHQASEQSIVQWGTFQLQIVCRVIPEDAQPSDPEEREKWSWWKAKKWAHHSVNSRCASTCSPC